jgi:hypothetical protein
MESGLGLQGTDMKLSLPMPLLNFGFKGMILANITG